MVASEESIVLFWFRRDLRLIDNTGLFHALTSGSKVLPVFVFDTNILGRLEDSYDRRVHFIHQALVQLKTQLESLGSTLMVRHGDPLEVYKDLLSEFSVKAVYTNLDYEPYATSRDGQVAQMLASFGVEFHSFKDQCVFEKDEVLKDDGTPYTVFTPYSKKWKARMADFPALSFPSEHHFSMLFQTNPMPMPTLDSLGFSATDAIFPSSEVPEAVITDYHLTRDFPAQLGTSRLSVHLRFGTISIREVVRKALQLNGPFLNELIWRDFYMMILWHFPHVTISAFKPIYDHIRWENNEDHFKAWCEGMTGYPIVDAGMRELNSTGFLHNRVRMIVASFLTKHLLIDWRWGEAYFARKLLDFDLSANNGGWQWAAGSGCDAAPYFRVFSPEAQTLKFDPRLEYVRRWIPEFEDFSYPRPIVNHQMARERALVRYREALQ